MFPLGVIVVFDVKTPEVRIAKNKKKLPVKLNYLLRIEKCIFSESCLKCFLN